MKKQIRIFGITLLSLMLMANCKKETGPKGETGPAGATGTTGIKGDQVFTFTTSASSWNAVTWPYSYQETSFPISAINSSVVSGGDVRVYLGDATASAWTALPYSFITNQYSYIVKTGQVDVNVTLSNANMPPNPGTQIYKVIVLPPAFIKNHPDLDMNDFKQVEYFID